MKGLLPERVHDFAKKYVLGLDDGIPGEIILAHNWGLFWRRLEP